MRPADRPVFLWYRNDLRLADQAALPAAAAGRLGLPIFALDLAGAGAWAPGGVARWWLHHSLAAPTAGLAAAGTA